MRYVFGNRMLFNDWDVYMKEHKLQHRCRVYLSLGGKEEKTKNKVMAMVESAPENRKETCQRNSMAVNE